MALGAVLIPAPAALLVNAPRPPRRYPRSKTPAFRPRPYVIYAPDAWTPLFFNPFGVSRGLPERFRLPPSPESHFWDASRDRDTLMGSLEIDFGKCGRHPYTYASEPGPLPPEAPLEFLANGWHLWVSFEAE